MASAIRMIGGKGSSSWMQVKEKGKKKTANRVRVCCSASSHIDPYKTLRIQPGASESEVKKAFRQLALQYHPDVCRGSNCGVQFQTINEAYDIVMNNLREQSSQSKMFEQGTDEPLRGMDRTDYDLWEEWMGWEGAGIRDYSSHINPYI
ncbi:chaperone protein dnaJ 8, chloroplastic-like [Durio zibethinus]|uniref:Chaperone protein dnaJ 8, chloroplastic-like n=1 Tax=Durio zibethinus TaxID=66656 RepID=A0A6P5WXD8_DURZI|nr:chaperone protein dnaJ 8, chloroplastic-like [Durio zibethinus]